MSNIAENHSKSDESSDLNNSLSSLQSQIDGRKRIIFKKYVPFLSFIQTNDKKISIKDLTDLRIALGLECKKLIQTSISLKIEEMRKQQGFIGGELSSVEDQCIAAAMNKFEFILSMESTGYSSSLGSLLLNSLEQDIVMPKIFASSGSPLPTKDQTCDDLYQLLELIGLLIVQKELNNQKIREIVSDRTFQLTQLSA